MARGAAHASAQVFHFDNVASAGNPFLGYWDKVALKRYTTGFSANHGYTDSQRSGNFGSHSIYNVQRPSPVVPAI